MWVIALGSVERTRGPPADTVYCVQAQQRALGKTGKSKSLIFSEDRGRYVKPMLPKGMLSGTLILFTQGIAAPSCILKISFVES